VRRHDRTGPQLRRQTRPAIAVTMVRCSGIDNDGRYNPLRASRPGPRVDRRQQQRYPETERSILPDVGWLADGFVGRRDQNPRSEPRRIADSLAWDKQNGNDDPQTRRPDASSVRAAHTHTRRKDLPSRGRYAIRGRTSLLCDRARPLHVAARSIERCCRPIGLTEPASQSTSSSARSSPAPPQLIQMFVDGIDNAGLA
jgi:hypothetical protein